MCAVDPNTGPCTRELGTLPNEPSSQILLISCLIALEMQAKFCFLLLFHYFCFCLCKYVSLWLWISGTCGV